MQVGSPPQLSAAAALGRVAAFAVVGAGLAATFRLTGLGLPCPFRAATGWLCPLCGGTHLGASLLTGDLAAAWQANPLVFLLLIALAVRTVGWISEVWLRPRGSASRRWLPARVSANLYLIVGLIALVFTLARNLIP